ncbi:MAG: hypothetical protein K0R84_1353 [Clostridia bacterium]|jgi:sugar lactone lactonase YvrE|nr:hypothetical protein [Clostridia bacterium]
MRQYYKSIIIVFTMLVLLLISGCSGHASKAQETESLPAEAEAAGAKVFATGFEGSDGITIDYAGNMYVGNRSANTISRVTKEGAAEDFVKLECAELLCLTVDKENNIYAAGKDKVFKISPRGEVTELAGGFSCADDLRLDLQGNIYLTDSYENRVYRITPDLKKSIYIDSDESRDKLGSGWHITGITFDNRYENLYIARMKKGEILKYPINPDGSPGEPEIILNDIKEPDHLEMDKQGRLYITLFRSGSLIRADSMGSVEYLCDGEMHYATGIVLGRSGFDEKSAYVADYGDHVVYQIGIE